MTLHLPDLGGEFSVTPVNVPADPPAAARKAQSAQFSVEPGVWLLTRATSRLTDRRCRLTIGGWF